MRPARRVGMAAGLVLLLFSPMTRAEQPSFTIVARTGQAAPVAVLRKVQPRWYLKFPANAPLLAAAGAVFPHTTYGRIGTIFCNHEPAIEVLEIVSGLEKTFDERVL